MQAANNMDGSFSISMRLDFTAPASGWFDSADIANGVATTTLDPFSPDYYVVHNGTLTIKQRQIAAAERWARNSVCLAQQPRRHFVALTIDHKRIALANSSLFRPGGHLDVELVSVGQNFDGNDLARDLLARHIRAGMLSPLKPLLVIRDLRLAAQAAILDSYGLQRLDDVLTKALNLEVRVIKPRRGDEFLYVYERVYLGILADIASTSTLDIVNGLAHGAANFQVPTDDVHQIALGSPLRLGPLQPPTMVLSPTGRVWQKQYMERVLERLAEEDATAVAVAAAAAVVQSAPKPALPPLKMPMQLVRGRRVG